MAQLVKNPPAMRETWVRSLGWEDPLEKGKATYSSILAWRIVHGAAKSQTRLNDFHRGWQCLTVPGAQWVLIKSMPYKRVVQVLPAQGWQGLPNPSSSPNNPNLLQSSRLALLAESTGTSANNTKGSV